MKELHDRLYQLTAELLQSDDEVDHRVAGWIQRWIHHEQEQGRRRQHVGGAHHPAQ